MKNYRNFLLPILFLIAGISAGYLIAQFTQKAEPEIQPQTVVKYQQEMTEQRGGGYEFINPLLECDNYYPSKLLAYVQLEKDLKKYINQQMTNGSVSHVSVYFRALNNGPWIGINEDHNYSPASLLKVPILIAALKKIESDMSLLDKKFVYDAPLDTNYTPNILIERLTPGNSYTVNQLLESMIINSDNDAKELIFKLVGDDFIIKSMAEIGLKIDESTPSEDFVSVKTYSSFFRILYNATYLNREMSEKALEMLSRAQFREGIPGKLPQKIKVAHKFGERGFVDSNIKQLHDCGIVYLPNSPYLICIMTKGNDFNRLRQTISEISLMVYNQVSVK